MMVSSRQRESQSDALSALFTSCLTVAAYYEASTTNLPGRSRRRLGQVHQAGKQRAEKNTEHREADRYTCLAFVEFVGALFTFQEVKKKIL